MVMKEFTGEELIRFIENYPQFKAIPIKYLFIELLKKNLIMPSDIIDAYSQVMQDKLKVARSHYEDACTTALQMESGNFTVFGKFLNFLKLSASAPEKPYIA